MDKLILEHIVAMEVDGAGGPPGAREKLPLELHLTTSELWFGQDQEGILP